MEPSSALVDRAGNVSCYRQSLRSAFPTKWPSIARAMTNMGGARQARPSISPKLCARMRDFRADLGVFCLGQRVKDFVSLVPAV